MKTIYKVAVSLFVLSIVSATVNAQDGGNKIKQLLQTKTYIFNANTAMPQRGNSIPLTSFYTLQVGADTVVSDLPYFGRAFSAPINPSEGGIKFTSTNFGYTIKDGKNGSHDILITPKDASNTQQLRLSISENGYATLNVTSNNKDNITFYGTVTEVSQKKG